MHDIAFDIVILFMNPKAIYTCFSYRTNNIKHISAGLWNVITMGMGSSLKNVQVTSNGIPEEEERKRDTETPLASQSLLLLLVLTNHCTATQNPYRNALFTFVDMEG